MSLVKDKECICAFSVSSLISVHLSTIFAVPVAFLPVSFQHSAPGVFSSLQLKMSETIFFLFWFFFFLQLNKRFILSFLHAHGKLFTKVG